MTTAEAPVRERPAPSAKRPSRQGKSSGQATSSRQGTRQTRPPAKQATRARSPEPDRTAAADTASAAPAGGGLAERAQQLIITAIDKLAKVAVDKVDDIADKFEEVAANPGGAGGIGMNALLQGGLAKLQGKNPVVAAIKGAFGAMSTGMKIGIGLLLILTAVLAPVVLLVVALGLIIAAIAGAIAG